MRAHASPRPAVSRNCCTHVSPTLLHTASQLDRLVVAGRDDAVGSWRQSIQEAHRATMLTSRRALLELCYSPTSNTMNATETPTLGEQLSRALDASLSISHQEPSGSGHGRRRTFSVMRSILERHLQQLARVQLLLSTIGSLEAYLRRPADLATCPQCEEDAELDKAAAKNDGSSRNRAADHGPPSLGDIPSLPLIASSLRSCEHLHRAFRRARQFGNPGTRWQEY